MSSTMIPEQRPAAARPDTPQWHALAPADVLARIATSWDGLTSAEAERRLRQYGPNRMDLTPPTSVLTILLLQFRSVVVALLFAAGAAAWLLGDPVDAMAIAAVLVINAALGFFTELRARRAMEALRRLEVPHATVVRDARRLQIDAYQLVPGDVIEIESGQSVPADARLLAATDLRTAEASLTGESLPVDKRADAVLDSDVVLAERRNMLYQSTAVVAGAGRAVVTATGNETEVGHIGQLTSALGEERTPLELRLDALGRRLVWLALGVALLVGVVGLLRGQSLGMMLQTAIALAIAAVPEGLPAVATIALAVGVWRMARRQALVRRLPAVETLGSATVVCADKTGTLTAGEMAVTTILSGGRRIDVSGGTYAPEGTFTHDGVALDPAADPVLAEALRIGALANRAEVVHENGAWRAVGDPTEAALLVLAQKGGMQRERLRRALPERGEIPFSSERLWMGTFHEDANGETRLLLKGAPGRVIERCATVLTPRGVMPLDDAGRQRLLDDNRALASRGLRVLALATAATTELGDAAVHDLTFVALAGIQDPAAPGVEATIALLRGAGIRTVMITGDQQLTAEAVAGQLGLMDASEESIDGRELAAIDETVLSERLKRTGVFNRVSPADKLRIVHALQRSGEIVAMLGDGVNDAAALKKADIGVAMGRRGTDVAKDAADVILADDRFPTIAAAVEEGRIIFDNIRKFVFYLFSCNLAEVLILLVAGIAALPQPLLPLQILWLNIVTDTFPALALAVEPGEAGVMRRPPRDPQVAILSRRFLTSIAFYSMLITFATLGAFVYTLEQGDASHAGTVAFVTLALAQGFHLGNARRRSAVLQPAAIVANRWALGAIALVIALQVAALHVPPLAAVLRVEVLTTGEWLLAFSAAAFPAIVGQAIKLRRRK